MYIYLCRSYIYMNLVLDICMDVYIQYEHTYIHAHSIHTAAQPFMHTSKKMDTN